MTFFNKRNLFLREQRLATRYVLGVLALCFLTATNSLNAQITGGTITNSNGYTIHTFTSSGTLVVPSGVAISVDVLVVAGGGGGGNNGGGGGGAGGVVYQSTAISAGSVSVTIGSGGAGALSVTTSGSDGTASSFGSVSAVGGGGGGSRDGGGGGRTGGSGGGGGGGGSPQLTGGTGTSGQGNAGGTGISNNCSSAGGGGGGAGVVGTSGQANTGGNGGAGVSNSITGTAVFYGGGGGAGITCNNTVFGTGGSGGGGNGGGNPTLGTVGTPNTGGGGGGGGGANVGIGGKSGGSGVVIVRYLTPSVTIAASSTTICAGTSVTFTATPTNGGSTPTYVWKNGSTIISGQTANTYTTSTLANGDVITCIMTSNLANVSPTTATSAGITMTVNALPTAYNVTGTGSYCPGGAGVAVGLSNSEIGVTYQLKNGATNVGSVVNGTGSAISFGNQTTAATYTVVATKTSGGCTATMTGSAIVTVNPTVTPSVSIAATPSGAITAGTSVTFTATPTNQGTTPTYTWKKGSTTVGTNSTTYTDAGLANGDVITCVMTSNATCASPASATSNQIMITVTTGEYLNFDGTNDVITATQQTTVSNNFTMEFWARPTGTIDLLAQSTTGIGALSAVERYVIFPVVGSSIAGSPTGSVGAGVSVGTNGVCVIEHGPAYLPSLLTWTGTISGWTHIAVVYTNKQPRLYINGVLTATGLTSVQTNVYVTTNSYGGGAYGYFSGDLDELRIWDSSLSLSDISSRRNSELTGNEAGLIDYYKFNQGVASGTNPSVTTLTDATTPANNGTLTSFTLTGTASNWLAPSPVVPCTTFLTPSVSITANPSGTITAGTSVTFTATPTNQGTTPTYVWKKGSTTVGTNSTTYTDAGLANGDVITCVMTSNATCASPTTVTSNQITTTLSAGEYLNFDGVDDAITATQQTTVKDNFTIEFWARPTATITLPAQATDGYGGLTGQKYAIHPTLILNAPSPDACAGVSVGTNGVCVIEHNYGYLPSLLTWSGTISGWTHIAVVYTNKQPSLYINCNLVATGLTSLQTNVFATTTNYGGGQYGYFSGDMDDLRIWNTSLSLEDILARKNAELVGNEAGLIDYYKFNQGTASGTNTGVTTLIDATTGNNGTLNNFALTGTTSNWLAPSPFTIGIPACPVLPITLLDFNGKNENGHNFLSWTTANEVNNKGFQVERQQSTGNSWEVLGFVKAQGKSASYDFTDNAPLSTSYYRLRQIDNDGTETLSKIVTVSSKGSNKLKVYPNPVSNVLTIENTEGGDFQILNLLGQEVLTGKAAQRIDVSALPQGAYFLKVGAEQVKFIKQ